MSASHICSTTFIWLGLMAMVTLVGRGRPARPACGAVSSLSQAASPSPSGAKLMEPPTWMTRSGTRARMPAMGR